MNKKALLLTLLVAVLIAAIAYIAGSVNKDNDKVAAENTNTTSVEVTYSELALIGSDITMEIPNTFSTCPQASEFFPGLVAYSFRDTDCATNTQDAPDVQIFVVASSSPEDVIRDKGEAFLTSYPNTTIEQKTVEEETIFFVESDGEYLVAKQVGDEVVYISGNRMELWQDYAVIDHMIASAMVTK